MSDSKPLCSNAGNGDRDGAVSGFVCAHCGGPVAADATIDIYVSGATLLARSHRGRAALLLFADGIDELVVDFARAVLLVDGFNEMGLTCVRSAEEL
jgi:hypothetical protein